MTDAEISQINDQLLRIWNEAEPQQALYPMLHERWRPGGLLTIGINPAFQIETVGKKGEPRTRFSFLDGDEDVAYIKNDPDTFYGWSRTARHGNFNIAHAHKAERLAREKYKQFFGPCWKVRDRLRLHGNWHHLDILSVRRTDQSSLTCSMNRDTTLTAFGKQQLDVFMRLLALGQPDIIVFFNVTAARIYLRERGLDERDRNCEFECYVDRISNRAVPVLVTGPRGDSFTWDRLAWHAEVVMTALKAGKIATQAHRKFNQPL